MIRTIQNVPYNLVQFVVSSQKLGTNAVERNSIIGPVRGVSRTFDLDYSAFKVVLGKLCFQGKKFNSTHNLLHGRGFFTFECMTNFALFTNK